MTDLRRGYRHCSYHEEETAGAHVHFPLDGAARHPIAIASADEAEAVVRAYARKHAGFKREWLDEVIDAWKSVSKSD